MKKPLSLAVITGLVLAVVPSATAGDRDLVGRWRGTLTSSAQVDLPTTLGIQVKPQGTNWKRGQRIGYWTVQAGHCGGHLYYVKIVHGLSGHAWHRLRATLTQDRGQCTDTRGAPPPSKVLVDLDGSGGLAVQFFHDGSQPCNYTPGCRFDGALHRR
jgi:hypothetical protein